MATCRTFSIEANGNSYNCTQTISGERKLRQLINVEGLGQMKDPAEYGDGAYPVESMDAVARLIALEILKFNTGR